MGVWWQYQLVTSVLGRVDAACFGWQARHQQSSGCRRYRPSFPEAARSRIIKPSSQLELSNCASKSMNVCSRSHWTTTSTHHEVPLPRHGGAAAADRSGSEETAHRCLHQVQHQAAVGLGLLQAGRQGLRRAHQGPARLLRCRAPDCSGGEIRLRTVQ